MDPDPRWADMYASVGLETFGSTEVIMFRIVVWYGGERHYTNFAADPAEFEQVNFDLYSHILDGMVDQMDKHLSTKERS